MGENLKRYSNIYNITKLSPLEAILLIDGLREKYNEKSKMILKNLEMRSKLRKREDDVRNQLFDTLLTSQEESDDDLTKKSLKRQASCSVYSEEKGEIHVEKCMAPVYET